VSKYSDMWKRQSRKKYTANGAADGKRMSSITAPPDASPRQKEVSAARPRPLLCVNSNMTFGARDWVARVATGGGEALALIGGVRKVRQFTGLGSVWK
jgi:hypothetical protein